MSTTKETYLNSLGPKSYSYLHIAMLIEHTSLDSGCNAMVQRDYHHAQFILQTVKSSSPSIFDLTHKRKHCDWQPIYGQWRLKNRSNALYAMNDLLHYFQGDYYIPSCKLFQVPWFISRSNYSSTNPRKAEDFSQQKLHQIEGQEIEKMFQIAGFIARSACYANFSFFRSKSIYNIFSAKSAAFEI